VQGRREQESGEQPQGRGEFHSGGKSDPSSESKSEGHVRGKRYDASIERACEQTFLPPKSRELRHGGRGAKHVVCLCSLRRRGVLGDSFLDYSGAIYSA
jgi:hypothetical protein